MIGLLNGAEFKGQDFDFVRALPLILRGVGLLVEANRLPH
jgi:hypothetical protein